MVDLCANVDFLRNAKALDSRSSISSESHFGESSSLGGEASSLEFAGLILCIAKCSVSVVYFSLWGRRVDTKRNA